MPQSTRSTNADCSVDQLSAHLATTSIAHDSNGQWVYFPPGTSLDEQLLILAGVEDYQLTGAEGETFSSNEINSAERTYSYTEANRAEQHNDHFNVKQAMDQHLALLTDADLSSMMQTSLTITPKPPIVQTQTPPSTFTGFQPSNPPGSLYHLITLYTPELRTCTSPHDLANAPLPSCNRELEQLSQFMAQYVGRMCEEAGFVMYSPKAHPLYPLWMVVETKPEWREEQLDELLYGVTLG